MYMHIATSLFWPLQSCYFMDPCLRDRAVMHGWGGGGGVGIGCN